MAKPSHFLIERAAEEVKKEKSCEKMKSELSISIEKEIMISPLTDLAIE